MKQKILFIHGFGGSNTEHRSLRELVSQYDCVSYSYDEKFGSISLDMLAKRVAEKFKKESFLAVVGISQGGIIATVAVEKYHLQTNHIITLCSPFRGSYLAYGFLGVGVKELRPQSALLREIRTYLKQTTHSYYAIYNPFDLMVFPGTFAKNPVALKQEKVYAIAHPFTFSHPKTIRILKKWIAAIDKESNNQAQL